MKSKKKKGFTLVELIVVIVIIGILAAVLVPSLTKYIDKANYSKDVQSVKTLNTYLENNSLLFYDMEINSREDVIELLKAENPDKELNLTVKSKGYYLWYDIDNKEIILETYENLEGKSSKQKLSARNSNSDRSCLSEFFKGYYFLDEGDSSLYKVIEIIDNLKDDEKNKKQSSSEIANSLKEALLKVKNDGYERAYEEYAKYLNEFSIDIDSNTKFEIKVSDYKIELKLTIDVLKCNHESVKTVEACDATCTEKGNIKYYVCNKCEKIFNDETLTNVITISDTITKAKGHTEVIDEAVAATCIKTGLTKGKHCSACHEVLVAQEKVSALGHDIKHHGAKAATCTEIGWEAYDECLRCDYTTYEKIDELGHDIKHHEAKAATCTEIGWEAYDECSRCAYTAYKEIAALGHKEEVTKKGEAATCTEDGLTDEKTCSACGKIVQEQEVVKATGHTEVIDEAVEAACIKTGLTEGKHCSACNEVLVKQTEIAAKGHTEVKDEEVAATCTEKGKTEGKHCSVCNDVLVAQTEIAAKGHTEVKDEAVNPTCTEKGKTEGKHCSVCNKILIAQTEISALEHDYSTELVTSATHHYHKCSRCGDEKDKEEHTKDYEEATEEHGIKCTKCGYVIETALEHKHTILEKHKACEATCTKDGNIEYYVCKCSKIFSDVSLSKEITISETVIEAKGHTEVKDAAVEATCTETGLTEGKHCSVCGEKIVKQEVIKAKGHTEVVDAKVEATCTKDGKTEGKHCSVCEKVLVAQTTIPAGHVYDDDSDMICNRCEHNRTSKVEVKFILPDGTLVHKEDVVFKMGVSDEGIEEAINKCNNKVSKESDYQVYKEFLGWYDKNDSTKKLVTDFSQMTEDKEFVALIEETVRSYNINIYYEDKDNIIDDSTYLTSDIVENHKFGTDINIKKQIQYNSLYLFYMSPKAIFGESDWLNLVNNVSKKDSNGVISLYDNDSNLEFLANIALSDSSATGTLELVVLCVQPAAIVSTVSNITWGTDKITINNDSEFYLTVEEALLNSTNSKTEYIRIYGQGKKSISQHAYLPDNDHPISAHSLKIDDITYTIPSYILNMKNKYTLGSDKNKEFTIEAEDTVILPYARNDATSDGYLLERTDSPLSSIVHSYLIINEKTVLNVNGSLTVGGVVVSVGSNCAGVVYTRAVIMNNGNIICNSGAKVKSYGYIKGENGTLELKTDATLIDVFDAYDYKGGQISKALSGENIFPVQVYSFHNVSCELKINYGAVFKVYGQIYASGSFLMKEDLTILGKNGLFELTEKDGYIIKSVEDTTEEGTKVNTSFISSNQDVTQREVLNIYGSFIDNSIKLKFSSASIETSTSMAMPIGMMKVFLNKGTGVLKSVSYKFLPGSQFIINDGATLTIESNVKVVFYDSSYNENYSYIVDGNPTNSYFKYSGYHSSWFSQTSSNNIGSKLIVNGYLNVKGYLGGKIDSTSNGKLLISNNSVTISELKLLNLDSNAITGILGGTYAKTEDKTYNSNGFINGYEIKTFDSNVTYYYTDAGYWSPIGSQSITFDSLGGNTFETIKFTSSVNTSNKVTTDLDKSLNFNSKYIPVKTGYTFAGWYFDKAYNYPVDVNDIMGTITLYAKWNANEYTITYNLNGGVLPNSYPAYHTYGKTTILPIPTKEDYHFSGWYLTSALNSNGDSSIASLDGTSYTEKIVLYARWEKDLKTYYVTLVDEVNDSNDSASLEDKTGTGVVLGKVCDEPNTDKDINFKGWFDGKDNKYDSTSIITSNITLYAKWQCTVTYNANDGTLSGNPVDTYEYGAKTNKPTDPTKNNSTFNKWLDESGNEFTFGNPITSNITLKAVYTSCFASGTIITLADGTKKKIEDVTTSDVLLVFDHENGVYTSASIIFIENDGMNYYDVIKLKFENGIVSRIIYEHAFFDLTLNKYVYITANNYNDYIGHSFAVYDEELKTYNATVLVESTLEEEYTGCYSLVTTYHMNYFIDGLFSLPGGIEGLFNYFEYDETLKYDEGKMEADILEYGLYTYDDFKDYIPYEIYEYVFPAKYFKVAVGKGMITFDEILSLIERYLVGHGII